VKRIGIFGGTFNPVHQGHLRTALDVLETVDLHEIWMIPAALPPHKTDEPVADAADRLAMLKRAVDRTEGLVVSDAEITRAADGKPSYTVDTLKQLRDQTSGAAHFEFLIGLDAFLEIHTWKDHETIFSLVPMIVLVRPGRECLDMKEGVRRFSCYVETTLQAAYRADTVEDRQAIFVHNLWKKIRLLRIRQLEISATEIRRRVGAGRSIRYLVPAAVENYMVEKGLYR
jgi:nicotinate-nucleotide adenylyltransferase